MDTTIPVTSLLQVERRGPVTVVRFPPGVLAGDQVAGAGRTLAHLLLGLGSATRQPLLVVNLAGVTGLSSGLAGKLMALSRWSWADAGGRMVLCGVAQELHEQLRAMELGDWFSVSSDEADAVAHVADAAAPARVPAGKPRRLSRHSWGSLDAYRNVGAVAPSINGMPTWSWRAYWTVFLGNLCGGAGVGFLLGCAFVLLAGRASDFPVVPLCLAVPCGLVGLYFAVFVGKSSAQKAGLDRILAAQTEALASDAGNPARYFNRAVVHRMKGDCYSWPQGRNRQYALALADVEEALRLRPDEPDAHVSRVNLLGAMGHHAWSVADYTAAVQVDPTCAAAYCGRATAFNALRQPDRGLADADAAIRLAPQLYLGHDARGYALLQRGDYHGAAAAFTEALRLNPVALDCYAGRSRAWQALGDHARARADAGRARGLPA
jgi:Flp pilus assembly protein TadD